jgi:hypothetical protein
MAPADGCGKEESFGWGEDLKYMDRNENFRRVKADYQVAFGEWAARVGRLRTLGEGEQEEARAQAEAAEAVYRETRDELAGMVCCG